MTRPTMDMVWMSLALVLAKRATCERLQVGAVLTDMSKQLVLGVGYNGNARGLANTCDEPASAGNCGCLHAEMNALLKATGLEPKVMYITFSPCAMCAKAMVNANVKAVHWNASYRDLRGIDILRIAKIATFEEQMGWWSK